MNIEDRYIPLDEITNLKKSLPALGAIVRPGNKVRVNSVLLEVVRINERKDEIVFKWIGVFPNDQGVEKN